MHTVVFLCVDIIVSSVRRRRDRPCMRIFRHRPRDAPIHRKSPIARPSSAFLIAGGHCRGQEHHTRCQPLQSQQALEEAS